MEEHFLGLVKELYKAFNFFNAHFCNNKLKQPIILITPTEHRMSGWCGKQLWKKENKNLDEINIAAELLRHEPEVILETLLHEMAHLKNFQNDIEDCNLKTQYHYLAFKDSAQSLGLKVTKTRKGWSKTSLTKSSREAIRKLKPKRKLFKKIYRK